MHFQQRLRTCYQFLPQRLQRTIYYRVLSKFRSDLRSWFTNVPLKLAPSIHMNLNWSDSFHGEIAFTGIYEDEVSKQILSIAKIAGGLLIDVGANYGYYSLLWCPASVGNRAFAIEASPRNIIALHENVAINGMLDRIKIYEWAASNCNGQASFDIGSLEETGWGGLTSASMSGAITVPSHRLDRHFADENISVLKIDCEGSDAWVIEGASNLLAAHRIQHVFFEENLYRQQQLGIEAGSSVRLLEGMGYQCDVVGPSDGNLNYHAHLVR